MSLYVSAFSGARFVHNRWRCSNEDHHYIWAGESTNLLDGRKEGCYLYQELAKRFFVEDYDRWLELLSLLAIGVEAKAVRDDPEEYRDQPFVELICMAGRAGAIGPDTSRKLAADIESLYGTAEQMLDALHKLINRIGVSRVSSLDEPLKTALWWFATLEEWRQALKLASDNGFVDID